MNYFSGIFMEVYISYWYERKFYWGVCGNLQDPGINLKRSRKNSIHGR
jgi:hypothetical protein